MSVGIKSDYEAIGRAIWAVMDGTKVLIRVGALKAEIGFAWDFFSSRDGICHSIARVKFAVNLYIGMVRFE